MPYYAEGDYYGQGDYYQGDPGLLGGLFKGVKKLAGAVVGKTPLGMPLAVGKALIPGISIQRPPPMIAVPPEYPGAVPKPGLRGAVERFLPGGASGFVLGRRRRMNPMNVKALRRATRRIDGFTRTARRALKHTGYMLVSRHAKGASRGVITRAEAARALKR